jgi:hypothetical protein
MAYSSLAVVRSYLGIPSGDSTQTDALTAALNAADNEIDNLCGRTFVVPSGTTTRVYYPSPTPALLNVDDIATATGLVVKQDTGDNGTYDETLSITSDYILVGNTPPYRQIQLVNGNAWPRPASNRPTIEVTAKFGYGPTAVPAAIVQAATVLAARLYQRRSSPLGFQAGNVDTGFIRIARNDPELINLLQGYRLPTVA